MGPGDVGEARQKKRAVRLQLNGQVGKQLIGHLGTRTGGEFAMLWSSDFSNGESFKA